MKQFFRSSVVFVPKNIGIVHLRGENLGVKKSGDILFLPISFPGPYATSKINLLSFAVSGSLILSPLELSMFSTVQFVLIDLIY